MTAAPLGSEQVKTALADLPGWSHEGNKLKKAFSFSSFREAIAFIVRLAFHAEEQNHHPEITNVYTRVDIALSTHDAGDKVTERDVKLAREIESFSWV